MQETPPNIPDARRRYFLALGYNYFDIIFDPYPTHHPLFTHQMRAVWCVLRGDHGHRMLIGACTLMVCLIWGFRPDPEGLLSTVLGEPQWAPPVTRLFAANFLLQLDTGDVKLNAWYGTRLARDGSSADCDPPPWPRHASQPLSSKLRICAALLFLMMMIASPSHALRELFASLAKGGGGLYTA